MTNIIKIIGSITTSTKALMTALKAPASCLIIFVFLYSGSNYADDDGLQQQRSHYKQAKEALANQQHDAFEQHYAGLGNYPLKAYIDYALAKRGLTELDIAPIQSYLEQHPHAFLSYRLRTQLLEQLAAKRQWTSFLRFYSDDLESESLECHALYAERLRNHEGINKRIAKIWAVGYSKPKACDKLFNLWKKNGGLTPEIAWKRFNAAMKARNRGLANYVSRLMPDTDKKYAELFFDVDGYPSKIKNHNRFKEQSAKIQQIIAHGIKRYARIAPKSALHHWELYSAQQLFPEKLATDVNGYLLERLIRKGDAASADRLFAQASSVREKKAIESLIRKSLSKQKWADVLTWIKRLDKKDQQTDRWRYWYARATEQLSAKGAFPPESTELANENFRLDSSTAIASNIYNDIAKKRSFYGFIAADILGKDYSFQQAQSHADDQTQQRVQSLPAMRRAKELWLMGYPAEAQAEWMFATKRMSKQELLATGQLARNWGWYNKGITAMISGNLWNYLSIRFPLAYKDIVDKASKAANVDQALIYAIARQESAFAANAKSSAGARGLMQLMPQTAKETAKKRGVKHSVNDLYKPEHNMLLGSQYLNELLTTYNGNRILAAAAYNAGPHRVKRWMNKTQTDVPFDIWIETIPFKETRSYVQNVLAFSVIYSYRLGQPLALLTEHEAKSLL